MSAAATPTWDPEGYPKLAHLLGRFPEAAVLRRFGSLNMMTLLSLQAKLVSLDADLWKTCFEDQESRNPTLEGLWTSLVTIHSQTGQAAQTTPGYARAQQLRAIQETLKEYYELLLLFTKVSELDHPRRDQTCFLQKWLQGEKEGKNFLKLKERFTWNNKYEFDFVVPVRSTSWLHPKIVELFHWMSNIRRPRKQPKVDFYDVEAGKLGRIEDFDSKPVARFLSVIGRLAVVLIASLLPILAVLVLFYIPRTVNRIGAAVGMTAAAALFLRFFTSASVKEIFGATAAFAAIVVVFIGSANGKT